MNKQPEVTARTRRRILDAYWRLAIERKRISAASVAARAGLNRSTFYQYFLDIVDLAHQAEDELIDEIHVRFNARFPDGEAGTLSELPVFWFEIMTDLGDRISFLFEEGMNSSCALRLSDVILPAVFLKGGEDRPEFNYLSVFGSSAVLGLVSYWYKHEKMMDLQDLIRFMHTLLFTGAHGYLSGVTDAQDLCPAHDELRQERVCTAAAQQVSECL